MDGGMGLHSYIAQVDLERKHVIHELNRAKLSSSHTRTFNVLMPVGLHLMKMQTQVPRISILHAVDPAEHSRVSGCCGVCPSIHLSTLEASQTNISAELRKPGQGFAWGQQWSPSAGSTQGVGSGRDTTEKEMAEILLTAVINKSVEIAGNVLFQEGTRLYWLKEDIDWLQREMRHIRSYIDNAKDKAIEGDTSVKNLIKDIQQLAGDVEDLLDDFLPKIQQSNKFICCLKTVSFADEFAMEIEKIKRRVEDIDRVRTTYNIMDTNNNNDCIPLDQRRLFLHADETEVIGLDDDFNMLKSKLLDHDLPYGVVSIVGMPGLGKTTLAKKLYRHVCDQFECSGLVYVSQQPRAGEILHDIAKQVGLAEEERKENLENNLRSLLKIKSRIIITSRNSNVGRYIGEDSSLHELQPLDSEKSFELFTKKIFTFDYNNNWTNASPDLVNIGRSIVGRCGGIPLAIVVTAGMLRARERT
ncbi:hypothetical protein KY290_038555 [Solanum tuberosum]|uniref:Uncharacterized protein n=1 Tax=Solanum tuberosum TaxID=4113 RepID=A0ABQ7U2E1_SOLTU|nr:hypothetical protein KY284_037215 [Solanum tuberosum]KAH0739850.1 hypothetical protein KY290_038555 [Solanum tuberosum]